MGMILSFLRITSIAGGNTTAEGGMRFERWGGPAGNTKTGRSYGRVKSITTIRSRNQSNGLRNGSMSTGESGKGVTFSLCGLSADTSRLTSPAEAHTTTFRSEGESPTELRSR